MGTYWSNWYDYGISTDVSLFCISYVFAKK